MNKTVEVLPDKLALVTRALDLVIEKLTAAIATNGQGTIVLSGGSTPKPLYEALANENLPWEKVHVFWGDERYVAPDHPDSNERMARAAWLNRVPIPADNIHPMPTDETDPSVASQKHEAHLQSFFNLQPGEFPQFDVILLGMGDDGHTASLFPHTDALNVHGRLVTVGEKAGEPRLTYTIPLINQANTVIFLVSGANKRPALNQIFSPDGDSFTFPARFIQPTGSLFWLLDAEAGQNGQLT